MLPQLLALNEGPSILLDKPILLIGRHQECDIQLPSRKISRRHCCIAQVKDHLVVRDLSSTNGIRINGVRVLEGCLRAGDELTIGNFRYQVRWENQEGVDGPPPVARESKRRVRPAVQPPEGDPLESCDAPVPLDEPAGPGQPQRPTGVPAGLPPNAFKADKHAPPPAAMLPDDLHQLSPQSEVQPPPGGPD